MDGTDTIFLVAQDQVLRDQIKDVMYGRKVVYYWPQKEEPQIMWLTVGGNLFFYTEDVSTLTVDITTSKIVVNSNMYTPGARYMCYDINNSYLGTPLIRYEYIKIPIDILPEEIILEYNLMNLSHNEYVYFEMRKVVYGLPQAGILVNQQLVQRLETKVYATCKHTQGLWRHKWISITFSLVVDDFGVKYVGKQHAEHLVNTIQDNYQVST